MILIHGLPAQIIFRHDVELFGYALWLKKCPVFDCRSELRYVIIAVTVVTFKIDFPEYLLFFVG